MGIRLQPRMKMSADAVPQPKQSSKADQKVRQALRAQASLVCLESPHEVQRFLEKLEQTGDIVQDVSPDDEDIPLENEDDTCNAEWDYADEDEVQGASDEGRFMILGADPYWTANAYVIRIHRLLNGRVEFDVPEMGGEGYRGVSKLGESVLGELSRRRRVYCAIAKWVAESGAVREADSPVEFLERHQAISQVKFLERLTERIPASSFSKYLNGARLAWHNGSIPLRNLFR